MAREATARLYDVDAISVVLKRLTQSGSYDTGTITFRAKQGKSVDLDKLHESVWATRLSSGTKSGLVSFKVIAIGEVQVDGSAMFLNVEGSDDRFLLSEDPQRKRDDPKSQSFAELRKAVNAGTKSIRVTGRLDGWAGRWPDVLRRMPPKPPRIFVTAFDPAERN